jgi:FkbM family methyltransferase
MSWAGGEEGDSLPGTKPSMSTAPFPRNRLADAYSAALRLIVKPLSRLSGMGAGRLTRLLPRGQRRLVEDYCGRYRFQVDTRYPIEAQIWLCGRYDATATRFLRRVLREGDLFLDVGANCGALALVAASLVGRGRVYAFEPGPEIRSRLLANIDLNPSLRDVVRVVPCGLGARRCRLFYSEDRAYPGNGGLRSEGATAVEVIPLDAWAERERPERIDFIKIDVEGMEEDVLRGATATIGLYRPIIYFETLASFFEGSGRSVRGIYELLAGFGYDIVSPRRPHRAIPFEGPYPDNSVAVPPERRERLASRERGGRRSARAAAAS